MIPLFVFSYLLSHILSTLFILILMNIFLLLNLYEIYMIMALNIHWPSLFLLLLCLSSVLSYYIIHNLRYNISLLTPLHTNSLFQNNQISDLLLYRLCSHLLFSSQHRLIYMILISHLFVFFYTNPSTNVHTFVCTLNHFFLMLMNLILILCRFKIYTISLQTIHRLSNLITIVGTIFLALSFYLTL